MSVCNDMSTTQLQVCLCAAALTQCLPHSCRCVCVLRHLHKRKGFCCVIDDVKSGRLYQQRCGADLNDAALQQTCYTGVPFGAVDGITPSVCEHQLHPEMSLNVIRSRDPQYYTHKTTNKIHLKIQHVQKVNNTSL